MRGPTFLLASACLLLAACGGEQPPPPAPETPAVAPPAPAAALPPDVDPTLLRVNLAAAAKRLCSSLFVSGRTREHVLAEELAEAATLGVAFEVGSAPEAVTARIGDFKETAVHRRHLGCTLLESVDAQALLAQFDVAAYPSPVQPDPVLPWPEGALVVLPETAPGIDLAAVGAAVDAAFAEPDPTKPVRTRAVVVIHDGRIVAERYAAPFDAATPQLGWSMTKTVTGTLTGLLAGDGTLNITAPAGVAAWQGAGDPRRIITLNNLLQMSSGLRFSEVYDAAAPSDVVAMLYGPGAADMGAFAAAMPLDHVPGSHWSYASGTTNLIASVLRDALHSQADYFAFPRARLFNPLGMASAVIEPDESGTFVGSSYMYATPRDWARLGLLYLQDGVWLGERLLPEGWVGYATTPAPAAPRGEYGAQIWLNRGAPGNPSDRPHPELPADLYYLSGFEGQDVVVVPSRDLVVVRMGLTAGGPEVVWDVVAGVLNAISN